MLLLLSVKECTVPRWRWDQGTVKRVDLNDKKESK